MYYEKVGIAILRPRIYQGKLDTFDVELIKPYITVYQCHQLGGKWIEDPTGRGCHIEIKDVADVTLDKVDYGRLFTGSFSPDRLIATKEYAITEKGGVRFQFDCGLDTNDLNVKVENFPPPTPFMEKHYLKGIDMACRKEPKEPKSAWPTVISPEGIAGTFPPGVIDCEDNCLDQEHLWGFPDNPG